MSNIKLWKNHNKTTIINNLKLIFRTKDIEHLNKPTYAFLYNLSGFIAHYDINGFKSYYSDLRVLLGDLRYSKDIQNPEYYLSDFFMKEQAEYYKNQVEILKEIRSLLNSSDFLSVEYTFQEREKEQDIQIIKNLAQKHNLKVVD